MGGNETYTVCRLCLSENKKFFDIFETKGTRGWITADIIIELLRFQVSSDDRYPHCVCTECMVKLEDFKLFKQQCETNKKLLDRAFEVKHGIQLSEELDESNLDHDDQKIEFFLREEDVEISIEKDLLDLVVDGNEIKTENGDSLNDCHVIAGVIESSDQELEVGCEYNLLDSEYIIKDKVLDIPAKSDLEDNPVKGAELGISGDGLMASTVNNSVFIPQKTDECSYSGDNILGAQSSSSPNNDLGTIGESHIPKMEGNVGNEDTTTEMDTTSSHILVCDICGAEFSKMKEMGTHMISHSGMRPFECNICIKSFSRKTHLEEHMSTHSRIGPFACSECTKTFSQETHLTAHMYFHSGIKPFRCNECGKYYSYKIGLTRHMLTHSGERPFKCSDCSRTFSQKSHLEGHKRTHTGEKPFRCKECVKTFSQKCSLERHTRTHTGEKPFRCTECYKTFSLKSNLEKHKHTHTGEKPFRCKVCNKCFSRKGGLKEHMVKHSGKRQR